MKLSAVVSSALLLVGAAHASDDAVHHPIDDASCKFSLQAKACVPMESCAFQYQFGDLTFDQSCRVVTGDAGNKPQQVHLAFAGKEAGTGMTISWATFTKVADPQVWVGKTETDLAPVKDIKVIVDSYYAEDTYSLYSYHATVSGLEANTKYFYKLGSAETTSAQTKVDTFRTARAADDTETFEVYVYGDLGVDANALPTIEYLDNLTAPIDMVYHIGDISYADNAWLSMTEAGGFFYEETYNHWMNMLHPIMKNVPYMVTVGNHESECHSPQCFFSEFKKTHLANYSAYNSRWHMPAEESGGVKNMWYSFEHGPVHYTTISTESDYENAPENSFIGNGINGNFGNQLAWLEADLKKADANRKNVPWVIVGMHRAIYTLDSADEKGVPAKDTAPIQKAFEELFIKYKVDVVYAGHVHSYERQFPIANNKAVMDGVSADGKLYANPQAPVYIVTGAPGNSEGMTLYPNKTAVSWVAHYDETNYGISSMTVNRTALDIKYLGMRQNGKVLDQFVITKN